KLCNEAPRSKLRGITELNSEDFSEGEANPVASYRECQVQSLDQSGHASEPAEILCRDDSTDSGRHSCTPFAGLLSSKPRTGSHTSLFLWIARSLNSHLQTHHGRLCHRTFGRGYLVVSSLGTWTYRSSAKDEGLTGSRSELRATSTIA